MAVTLGGLAAIAGGAHVLNNISTGIWSNINNKRAKEMAALNDQYQRKLMLDTPSINKEGVQKAGLSVASLNGNAFNSVNSDASANAVSANAPQVSPSDVISAASVGSQINVNKAQENLINQQAQELALKNRETEALQNLYSFFSDYERGNYYSDNAGKIYSQDEFNKLPDDKKSPDQFAPVSLPHQYGKEGYELSTGVYRSDVQARQSLNLYNAALYKLKADEDTIKKASKLDSTQQEVLSKQVDFISSQTNVQKSLKTLTDAQVTTQKKQAALFDIEAQVKQYLMEKDKATNPQALLQDIFKDGFSLESLAKIITAAIVDKFSSIGLR